MRTDPFAGYQSEIAVLRAMTDLENFIHAVAQAVATNPEPMLKALAYRTRTELVNGEIPKGARGDLQRLLNLLIKAIYIYPRDKAVGSSFDPLTEHLVRHYGDFQLLVELAVAAMIREAPSKETMGHLRQLSELNTRSGHNSS